MCCRCSPILFCSRLWPSPISTIWLGGDDVVPGLYIPSLAKTCDNSPLYTLYPGVAFCRFLRSYD